MSAFSKDRRRPRDVETAVFQYFVTFVFLWLLAAFWQLQVREPEVYEERAARNSIKSMAILAPRGKIFDRDGRVLVDNQPSFKVLISRNQVNFDRLPLIAEGLDLPYESLTAFIKDLRKPGTPDYRQVVLKENLTPSDVAFLEAHQAELQELELVRSQRRLYPRGGLAAHIAGYVSKISEKELQQEEFKRYKPGSDIGKAGVERRYNDVLTGVDGSRLVLVDSRSRRVRDLDVVEAQPGRNLSLTIDLDLQAVAELAMEGRRGAVVALDPRNGEVLALVSRPAYDPNEFVGGISGRKWSELINDPDKPMLNRAVQAQLAPGSIYKPVVALAALATGAVNTRFQVHCGGGATFYGRFFRCHKPSGHGWVDMEKAMAQSCDVYFYTIGKELGIERLAEYSKIMGLGSPTGIDLPHENDGVVPSPAWKLQFLKERWYAGETISVAIGQGALTVTPLQAAYAIGGLAVGGVWHKPHLLPREEMAAVRPEAELPEPTRLDVSQQMIGAVVRGMWEVVNNGGTGVRAAIPGYDVCGKTGTAQRVSRRFAALHPGNERYKDDGWFVGFAPCKDPEIVVTVLVENGEHGSWTAPVVRDVIKAHFDKQKRIEWTRGAPPRADPAHAHAPEFARTGPPVGGRE